MMPEEYASPEEKLLKLIRGDKKSKEKPATEIASGQAELSRAYLLNSRTKIKQTEMGKRNRDYLKLVNITLVVILIIIAGILLLDTVMFNLRKEPVSGGATLRVDRTQAERIPQPEKSDNPANFSRENGGLIETRELFKPRSPAPQGKISEGALDRLNQLSLKGIIAGDKPQVVLEDEKNKKSYFLYKGDSVGNIKVEDIQADKVILMINGEVLELTL